MAERLSKVYQLRINHVRYEEYLVTMMQLKLKNKQPNNQTSLLEYVLHAYNHKNGATNKETINGFNLNQGSSSTSSKLTLMVFAAISELVTVKKFCVSEIVVGHQLLILPT